MHLVVVFGPPAVGKMTVGHEICARTGYKLFHNHMTIEPFLGIFEFGSPSFLRLSGELRRRVVQEAVAADLPGLVFTFVWGLELEEDRDFVQRFVDVVEEGGGKVSFVELAAPLPTRLDRNNTEFRLAEKKSKRDRTFNDDNLRAMEEYVMNTRPGVRTVGEDLLDRHPHLRVDNTDRSAADVADEVAAWLGA
ncbi:MAG: hypothetical protein HOQ22_18265 [Nocardioidaceae bacterium]|nr:hypothetical protein [Nocardioidaceae bacterium]NUS52970.1 hypothetical protein [Nocardioidaceae bacterium]